MDVRPPFLRVAFDLEDHALIELTGEDRLEWLQGQATNDVRGLLPGTRLSFCFCQPTGQLLAVVDAWAFEDRIVMATARACAAAVLERVERMTILEDVAASELPQVGLNVPFPPEGEGFLVLPSNRRVSSTWDVWGLWPEIDALKAEYGIADREASRIVAGIPRWGVDMGTRTLPPELGPAFEARHVSYEKGCYTGQEVLMRMHTRGHTNRTWVGLVADAPLVIGEAVMHDGREVGRVSSSTSFDSSGSPLPSGGEGLGVREPRGLARDLYIGAATLKNEATSEGTKVVVGEANAVVRTMPISGAV